MRIGRIRIENFRSIKSVDIQPSKFNVFVGQNNHGKTNLFEALDWFYTGSGEPAQIVFGREICRKTSLLSLKSLVFKVGLSL